MQHPRFAGRLAVTVGALVWLAPTLGAQNAPEIVVTPLPVGSAAQLVATRSGDGDSIPELPVDALEPASPEPQAAVTTRATAVLAYNAAAVNKQIYAQKLANVQLAKQQFYQVKQPIAQYAIVNPPPQVQVQNPPLVAAPLPRQGYDTPPYGNKRYGDYPSYGGYQGNPATDAETYALYLEHERQMQVYETLRDKVEEVQELRRERQAKAEDERVARKEVFGPSALGALNLLENLHVDKEVQLYQTDILTVDHIIYQDANPKSGIFYYHPKRYDLMWDPDTQYAMTVIYGLAGQAAGEGEVFMAARMRAGVDTHELEVVKDLLRSYRLRHTQDGVIPFRSLRPVPLDSTSEVELFGGAANEFSVPQGKISVQRISGLLGTMDVSWATDVRRLLNVEALLRTDAGIHGNVTFHTAGDESFSRTLPLEIHVASPHTFGRIRFERDRGWTNRTLYPVRLHYLHALMIAPENKGRVRKYDPLVYSWSLDDTVVPPGASIRWNAQNVPGWIDTRSRLLWVEYSVDGSCESCDEKVFDEKFIPAMPTTQQLVFTTGEVFETTGAERVMVHIRSPFLDPQRNRVVQQPAVMLNGDGEEYPIAKLFLTEREINGEGENEPYYEYFLEVTMKDGTRYASPRWLASRQLDYLLGSAGVREAFGFVPGLEEPPQADAPVEEDS